MANKDFSYGSMAVPSGEARYSIIRWGWGGLNRSDLIDSGQITDCDGVSIDPPYVLPSPAIRPFRDYAEPIGVYGFDDFLLVLYRSGGNIMADYCVGGSVYTGKIGAAKGTAEDFVHRSVVQFNVAEGVENIVSAHYVRKLLIFPDRVSMDFHVTGAFSVASLGSAYPSLKYATVYGSRVFGVDDNLVYASAYNDYADWELDTADDTSSANAWVSMSQSNAKADGMFTGIYTYDNHVVLFKKDFTQLVYNDKNPFRIVDVTSYGAANPRAFAEAEGVLYFASADMVYAFTGGMPSAIGEGLGSVDYRGCCMGAYKDRVYVSAGGVLYRYRDGVWSSRVLDRPILQFAVNENGLYGMVADGIVMVDWADAASEESSFGRWWFETDFMAAGKLNIRRVKKITVLCQIARGASVSVYLLRNGEKFDPAASRKVLESKGYGWRTLCGLVRGMSADMHRLRFVGNGYVKIHAAELQVSFGGDLYKEH